MAERSKQVLEHPLMIQRTAGLIFNEIDLLLRGVCSIFLCHFNLMGKRS